VVNRTFLIGALPIHAACYAGCTVQLLNFLVKKGGLELFVLARDSSGALPLPALCSSQPLLYAVKYLVGSYPASLTAENCQSCWPASHPRWMYCIICYDAILRFSIKRQTKVVL